MNYRTLLIRQLALTLINGTHSRDGLARSIADCINLEFEGALPLAGELARGLNWDQVSPTQLEQWLDNNDQFRGLYRNQRLKIIKWPLTVATDTQQPPLGAAWRLPHFGNTDELAQWCGLSPGDLNWYCQRYPNPHSDAPKLQHYHYQTRQKSDGQYRILETPKSRLKSLQRRLNRELLHRIPVHDAAHGFVRGRSVKSFSRLHVDRPVVLAMDLKHFFLSVPPGRLVRFFQRLGYDLAVSRALTGLCLNQTPEAALTPIHSLATRGLYRQPHLPQGAPTSPVLANLMAFRLDLRLEAAAHGQGFCYTRYADDLAFSSHRHDRTATRILQRQVRSIAADEGFAIKEEKTRVMTRAGRQKLAGVVVNKKQSLPKAEIKQLEAILYNCVRYGPHSQNRADHPQFKAWMEGKLAYVQHLAPHHFERLQRHFELIQW
ncbi:MAG: reverse transcriptase family protein [Pseudomonadota bacterium]|nr:reverse transcriptase family protein [Pseudomonadota bacterium]